MNRINLIFAAFAIFLFTSCGERNDNSDLADALINMLIGDLPAVTCNAADQSPYAAVFAPALDHYMTMSSVPVAGQEVWFNTGLGCARYDMVSGRMLHEISSYLAFKTMCYPRAAFYRHDGTLVAASEAGVVAISEKEGTLLWERKAGECKLTMGDLTGWGDQYFVMGHVVQPDKKLYGAIYSGTISGGGDDLRPAIVPNFSRKHYNWANYGRIHKMAAYTNLSGAHYLFVVYYEPVDNNFIKFYAGLYNCDRNAWEYDHIALDNALKNRVTNGFYLSPEGTAVMGLDGNLIEMDVMTGRNLRTKSGIVHTHLWGNDRFLVVTASSGEIAVFDRRTLQVVYRQRISGTPYIDFGADRLFTIHSTEVIVYELSTGRPLKTLSPPCSNDFPTTFQSSLAWWKDDKGRLQLAVSTKGKVYRYEL